MTVGGHIVALNALANRFAPQGAVVAVTDPRQTISVVWPEEAPAISRAVAARRREFAAGRDCARVAMKFLGEATQAVPSRPDRSPHWPPGLVGSISHDATGCIAMLGRAGKFRSVGVDLEPNIMLPEDLLLEICLPSEMAQLNKASATYRLSMARRIFCAKEAVYKAQYPLTGEIFGFDAVDIQLNAKTNQFVATITKSVGPIDAGTRLSGQCGITPDHVLAMVTLGAAQGMENADFPVCATG